MDQNRKLSNDHLLVILRKVDSAIAIYSGSEMCLEFASQAMLNAWSKGSEVIGKTLSGVWPETSQKHFHDILQNVWNTGLDYTEEASPTQQVVNGKLQIFYRDHVYQALKHDDGKVYAILHTVTDVTDKITIQIDAKHPSNEELVTINNELTLAKDRLKEINLDLQLSDIQLHKVLSELPIPVVTLMGEDQVISVTNQAILKLWNRTRDEVLGKPMLEVFPELKNQPYPSLWKKVYETGVPVSFTEKTVVYKDKVSGGDRSFYIDYFCEPLVDRNANRIGIISTVFDVTEKVQSRKQIEEAEARLSLALDSAKLGTWHIDLKSNELTSSSRLREIFGFDMQKEITLGQATDQILDSHRTDVIESIEHALATGAFYDIEYPIKRYSDDVIRWVHATGMIYGATGDKMNFSGIVQDITQRKFEEQRKDDFLSIASHELKTPVTALKGSLQLLNRKKNDLTHPMVPRLIDQAYVSVEKITDLIDDLLNTARSNAGQLHLNYSEFTISTMLEQCCQHIRMGGKHELIFQGDKSLKIEADEARIDQVVVNLVNNAAKYAPDQQNIYLNVENLGDRAKVSVRDTGPGIQRDKIKHLFERYYRTDYRGTQYSGLGLGLYISAEIIKRHNGEIGVDSTPGEGSTFWFTLPYKPLIRTEK
ncbi:PAS domain-containing sensor histidine kinase [Sphingobacterium sp. SGR-19]|uniref:PAS domain-containing sensor histidine kinase n=1 Tax=Sphingobacterium sp. SGR-19 TaxID=2710886 RepID=UPI0013EDAAC9|nr:PAS domain-containing sensor histidine kinase [Sphingobacterium sp. SGR-19]NGM65125.1 PAS domain-containing sensor histidine kinase [Sphingobacterium sp. SGR-19]